MDRSECHIGIKYTGPRNDGVCVMAKLILFIL